jgi:membrane protease YdiL (CAAX protease family)
MMQRYYARWLEFILLFLGIPLLINIAGLRWLMIITLWLSTLLIFLILNRQAQFNHTKEWNFAAVKFGGKAILILFLLVIPVLVLLTLFLNPNLLFSLPRTRPELWAMIMVLYPVLSVWPQELIFRSWLYHRYSDLWRSPIGYIILSAFAFGFTHLIFHNWIAVLLSTVGGALFAYTYLRMRSLALCCLEHTLYGCAIFTIGLGQYFYSGVHFH